MTGEDEASDLRKRLARALERITVLEHHVEQLRQTGLELLDVFARELGDYTPGQEALAQKAYAAFRPLLEVTNAVSELPCRRCGRAEQPRVGDEVKTFSCGSCGYPLPGGNVDRG